MLNCHVVTGNNHDLSCNINDYLFTLSPNDGIKEKVYNDAMITFGNINIEDVHELRIFNAKVVEYLLLEEKLDLE